MLEGAKVGEKVYEVMADRRKFCFPVITMLSLGIEVFIYGFITELTLREGSHHCFLVKLSHLSPCYLGELVLFFGQESSPINPFLLGSGNAESIL